MLSKPWSIKELLGLKNHQRKPFKQGLKENNGGKKQRGVRKKRKKKVNGKKNGVTKRESIHLPSL